MRLSPLRTIHPVPNRRNQEVEIGEKYVWKLYRLIKSITIKCPNMPMSLFSRNSIQKPKTCRITLSPFVRKLYTLKLLLFNHSFILRNKMHWRQHPGNYENQLYGFMLLSEYIIRRKKRMFIQFSLNNKILGIKSQYSLTTLFGNLELLTSIHYWKGQVK